MASRAKVCLIASAALSAVATVTLALFYTVGQPWGSINDLCYVGQAVAVLGALPAIRAAGGGASRSGVAVWAGLAATSLLVATEGIAAMRGLTLSPPGMPSLFLGIQAVFFLLTMAWLPITGRRLERAGLKGAWKRSLLRLTLIGYPVFALWLAARPALNPTAPPAA